jgi:hypothetical protein
MSCLLYAHARQLIHSCCEAAISASFAILDHTWRRLGYSAAGVESAVHRSVVVVSCVYIVLYILSCTYCPYVDIIYYNGEIFPPAFRQCMEIVLLRRMSSLHVYMFTVMFTLHVGFFITV